MVGKMLERIGWREWVALPELGIPHIKAKVDTGARTSALHTFSVEKFSRDGKDWVRFGVHPTQRNTSEEVWCESPLKDTRIVRDSGGHEEQRYVIDSALQLGDRTWTIEITLTDRDNMGFRMLLGRTAIRTKFLVNSNRSYLLSRRPQ